MAGEGVAVGVGTGDGVGVGGMDVGVGVGVAAVGSEVGVGCDVAVGVDAAGGTVHPARTDPRVTTSAIAIGPEDIRITSSGFRLAAPSCSA